MFQFPGFAPFRVAYLQYAGLPHSETRGSKVMCTSPRLIAAYRVLHRLREPRHPPYALVLLIVLFCSSMSYLIRFSRISFPNMSMNLRHRKKTTGQRGEYRSRTDDLLRARQAL